MLGKSSSVVDLPKIKKRNTSALDTPISKNSANIGSYITLTETTSTTESKSTLHKTSSTPSIIAASYLDSSRKMSITNSSPSKNEVFPDIRKRLYTPERVKPKLVSIQSERKPRIRCLEHILFDPIKNEPYIGPLPKELQKRMLQTLDTKYSSEKRARFLLEDSYRLLLEESEVPTDASKSIENEDYLEGEEALSIYYEKYRNLLRLMQKKQRKSPFLEYLDTCEREKMVPVPIGLIQRKFSRRDIHLK